MKIKIIAALALFLGAASARAAETAAFLDIGVGARGIGMGGAFTALADDSSAVYWNPAGLARLEKREFSASHAELGLGTREDFIAYAHPTARGTIAAGVTYLSQGAIGGRDATGRPTGDYQASDAAFAGAYGVKTDFADLGASVKYLRSHIASSEAQGVAADVGARRAFDGVGPGKIILGAALRNMGPGLKYENQRNDLPLRLAGGAAYSLSSGRTLAVEVQSAPRGGGADVGFGGEFKIMEGALMRLGWGTKSAAPDGAGFDAARGLTVGLGLERAGFRFDYAAQAAGELGAAHRFTLAKRF
ncbi:MAG: PorV/PorQ family protein [Elusimicrobia bacterium]|nr:PorV/PorQ family protein [Elusimicrobiota bacterium]